MEIITALLGALSLIVVAIVERRSRTDDSKWENNSKEHQALVGRIENIGSNLGRSVDRVESNMQIHLQRIENKIETHDTVLFEHLSSHAEALFKQEDTQQVKRRRNK